MEAIARPRAFCAAAISPTRTSGRAAFTKCGLRPVAATHPRRGWLLALVRHNVWDYQPRTAHDFGSDSWLISTRVMLKGLVCRRFACARGFCTRSDETRFQPRPAPHAHIYSLPLKLVGLFVTWCDSISGAPRSAPPRGGSVWSWRKWAFLLGAEGVRRFAL